MSDEAKLVALPEKIDGDVVMRLAGDGTVVVEGWVASFGGHRRALEIARNSAGVRRVDDRLMIVLGRQIWRHNGRLEPPASP